ncbi:MAG: hypothetical protein HQK89_04775 [Nitrospirae bacterium]|nr:hypothetical protein [Nitrospirota bacterium]
MISDALTLLSGILPFCMLLFGGSILFISTTSRLDSYLKILTLQGVLLFLMVIGHADTLGLLHTALLTLQTLVVKAIAIPLSIYYILKKLEIKRETGRYIGGFLSLVVATAILVMSFVLAVIMKHAGSGVDVLSFGVSMSSIVYGLVGVITRTKFITQVMGYLIFENGVFMMSLALSARAPVIVEAGVALDVFVGVFLIVIFLYRIKSSFISTPGRRVDPLASPEIEMLKEFFSR